MNDHTFTVLIADDEELAQDSIKILLEKVDDCKVLGTASNGKDALNMILTLQPNIAFIDIQMPYLLGTEVVEQISNQSNTFFIFVTAFDNQAIKAFELNAVDYLLKPFSDHRFYQSLNKAKKRIKAGFRNPEGSDPQSDGGTLVRFRSEFAVKSIGKIELVSAADVLYLKSSGNYIELFTATSKYLMRGSLSQVESELDPDVFVRIHRSSIIKKSEIKELQNYMNGEYLVIMKNGIELKLSRSYKSSFKSIVNLN